MHAIFLNGPPGSGKDTAADVLCSLARRLGFYECEHMKFSEPLKDAAHRLFGLWGAANKFEEVKDTPIGEFLHHTPRSVYIALSEEFAKPKYGNDFFGRVMVNELIGKGAFGDPGFLVVFSDSGFIDETLPVIRAMDSDGDSATLIRLHRPGHDFKGDSRGHLVDDPFDFCFDINNDGTLEHFETMLKEVFQSWFAQTQQKSTPNSRDAAPVSDLTSSLAGTE